MNKFVLLFIFLPVFVYSDSVFIRITSNSEQNIENLNTHLISELAKRGHSIAADRYDADWVFESEVIQTGEEILLSYLILIDSRSRNVFYEEFILHTWVSFYKDNFSRAATHFINEFEWVLEYENS